MPTKMKTESEKYYIPRVEKINTKGLKHHQLPACEHHVLKFPNSTMEMRCRCKLSAHWKVDGIQLCHQHAGRAVLPKLAAPKDSTAISETDDAQEI